MPNYYRVENRRMDADDLIGASDEVVQQHRSKIEPWLASILQSEHLNLLLGSGFSIALARAAGVAPVAMDQVQIDPGMDAVISRQAAASAAAMGRGEANIEDQLRAALALLEGLAILDDGRAASLRENLRNVIGHFAASIAAMEWRMVTVDPLDDHNVDRFESLLKSFLLTFCARTASRDRLHVFTTNYDRVIEHGFDLLGVRALDRFVGSLTPRYRSSRMDTDLVVSAGRSEMRPLEGVVRLTKLHGSIDWAAHDGEIVRRSQPMGTPPGLPGADIERLMIYPNSAKDIETAYYPYADLFRDFSSSICRSNAALVTYGYGFGDDHVNRILRDMLTLPSTHLVVISYSDPGGRIARFVEETGRSAQVSLLIGPELAGLERLVTNYLPKPAIDLITQRRTELLARRGAERPQ